MWTYLYTRKFTVELLPDEYWWGGVTHHGYQMPFSKEEFQFDLGQNLAGNQGAPLLLSNRGRYIWSEDPFRFAFKDGYLSVDSTEQGIIVGEGHKDLKTVYRHVSGKFFTPSGRQPSRHFFSSPQYNTWIEMGYSPTQEKVLQYAKDILDHGFPPGILMIDDNWQEDYGNWSFNQMRFPSPKVMVDSLRDMGFKVMLWTCPFVSPDSSTFRELQRKGLLVRDRQGDPIICRWWNGYSAVLDCTNPAAVSWYKEQNQQLVNRYGIDGFKMDAGDPEYYAACEDVESCSTRNDHCLAWAKIGLEYEFNELRASWKLGGQALVQRLRDKRHSWEDEGLNMLIPNGLAQGLLGYVYTCPDMIGGGLEGDFSAPDFSVDQELFVRYAQCSALFPMMQFSMAPWRVLDEFYLSLCVKAAWLHVELASEIEQIVETAAIAGEPIMRHLAYVFPDAGYETIQDQFMLGDRILVAPVLEKGQTTRRIIFPKGHWKGHDGSEVQGPVVHHVTVALDVLPWYRAIDS